MSCLSKNLNLIKMIFDLFSRKKSDGFLSNKDIQAFFLLVLDNKSPYYFQQEQNTQSYLSSGWQYISVQTNRQTFYFFFTSITLGISRGRWRVSSSVITTIHRGGSLTPSWLHLWGLSVGWGTHWCPKQMNVMCFPFRPNIT